MTDVNNSDNSFTIHQKSAQKTLARHIASYLIKRPTVPRLQSVITDIIYICKNVLTVKNNTRYTQKRRQQLRQSIHQKHLHSTWAPAATATEDCLLEIISFSVRSNCAVKQRTAEGLLALQ